MIPYAQDCSCMIFLNTSNLARLWQTETGSENKYLSLDFYQSMSSVLALETPSTKIHLLNWNSKRSNQTLVPFIANHKRLSVTYKRLPNKSHLMQIMKRIFDKRSTNKGIWMELDCIFLCHYCALNVISLVQKCNPQTVALKAGYRGDDYRYYDDLFRGISALPENKYP